MDTENTEAVVPTLAEQDQLTVARLKTVAGVLLLVLAAVSFSAGIPGLVAAGGWARLGSWSWLTPALIDGGLVFMAVAAAVHKAEPGRVAWLPWTLVVVLSSASVASQVVHVLGASAWVLTPEVVTGAVVASLFPIVVLASTRVFETLRFGQLLDRQAKRAGRGHGRTARLAPARKSAAASPAALAQASRPATRPQPVPRAASTAIDPAVKAEAVQRVSSGESQRAVAADLRVSRGAVQAWCRTAA